jgi:hypothetical protein
MNWSGAPKHWVEVPLQRQWLLPASVRVSARVSRACRASVAVGLTAGLAVLLLAVIGPGRSVAGLDGPGPGAVSAQ